MNFRRVLLALALVAVAWFAAPVARGQGGSAPILLVVNGTPTNPFGSYLAEILRAEGITAFSQVSLSSVDAPTLASAALVILAETPLTAGEAALFSGYVGNGGRLIAMRPDPQLYGVLGLAAAAGTTTNGYTLIEQSGPGAGLQSMTLPFKGEATHLALAGASQVAALYSTRTVAAGRPAVVRYGRTAAWAFDLARSTAYVRQGDPAYAGLDRDGQSEPAYRTNDIFYQTIDVQRVGVPHADVQMRLLTRVINDLLADAQPLPRLWYFPGTARTVMVLTGDSHTGSSAPYLEMVDAVENAGGRLTLYLSRFVDVSALPVATWVANGHELGLHPFFSPDGLDMAQGYAQAQTWWNTAVPVPFSNTVRHHSLEWQGWVDPVSVMPGYGVRMDTSYYAWGPALDNPSQASQAHGFITGSGLPMRYVDAAGVVRPVYQQVTSLTDEQLLVGTYTEGLTPAQGLAVTQQLVDASQAGGYSALMTQFHVDYYLYAEVRPWVDGTLAYAQSLGLPMWTTQRWLRFTEARAATTFTNVAWTAATRQLSFAVTVPAGAEPQTVLLPASYGGQPLASATLDGTAVAPVTQTVNGQATEFITVAPLPGGGPRQVVVRYADAGVLPAMTIGDVSVIEGNAGTASATFTVLLSAPAPSQVSFTATSSNGTATAGADYQAIAGGFTIPAGGTSRTFTVTVNGDAVDEPDETASILLGSVVGASVVDGVGVLTILDDDVPPLTWVHTTAADFGACSVASGTHVVPAGEVRLAPASTETFDGPALGAAWTAGTWAGGAYTPTFSAGTVVIADAAGAYLRSAAAVPLSGIEVRASVTVGAFQNIGWAEDGLTSPFAIFSTRDGSGHLWARTDPSTGEQATDLGPIPAGFHDYRVERVVAGGADLVRYSIDGLAVAEHTVAAGAFAGSRRLYLSNAGTTGALLAVDRVATDVPTVTAGTFDSCPFEAVVSVPWNTIAWTASVPGPGSLVVRTRTSVDGAAWSAWSAPVATSGAAIASPAGRFLQYRLELASSDLQVGPSVDAVTVTASEPPPPAVSIAAASATEAPGAAAQHAVTLSAGSLRTITVTYAATAGTATPGTDFTASSGTVTFLPGVTSQLVGIPVADDALDEDAETFTVTLSAPVDATLGTAVATGTIVDDDLPPALSIGDVTVVEGDTGTVTAAVPVTLSAVSGRTVSVTWATANGTATAGSDYTAAGGTLSIPAGVLSATASVPVRGDVLVEPSEAFTVTLSAPGNATLADAQGTVTVTDDDVLPTAVADGYATPYQQALTVAAPGVLANDSNDGGGPMTAQLVAAPSHGTVTLAAAGGFTYTPAAGYAGIDVFTYRVVDDGGAGNTVPVTIGIGLPPPVATADAYTTPFETALDLAAPGVLANDVDHGAPGLAAALVSPPAHGTLVLAADGGLRYTPAAGFTGADTFTYRVSSAVGAGNVATATVTVAAPTRVQVPTALRVADATAGGRVTLRWTAPTVGPEPTGYLVEGGLMPGQTLAQVVTPDTAPILAVDLGPGIYYVRVRTLGTGGPSDASAEVTVTVGPAAVPSTPTHVLATVVGQSVHLSWTPTFDGGPASGYVMDLGGALTGSVVLPFGERASFAGVSPGTYTLRLRAGNAAGFSAASPPVSVTVPVPPPVPAACGGTPDAPEAVLVYRRDGIVSVVWDPPTSGPAALGYEVAVAGFGSFPTTARSLSGAAPAGTYEITVRAVGACGPGASTPVVTVPLP